LLINTEEPAVLFSAGLFEIAAPQVGLVGLKTQNKPAEPGF
jgi:hypothetical protein